MKGGTVLKATPGRQQKCKCMPHVFPSRRGCARHGHATIHRAALCMEITDVQPPPHSAGIWRRRGDAELAAGDCTAAADSYRRAIAIEPDNPRAHNNLGQALMRLERRAEAIASYRRATQLAADYAVAYNNLGIALNADGETEAALAAFTLALEH